MELQNAFCKDSYPKEKEYMTFDLSFNIPKDHESRIRKWATTYKLKDINFKAAEDKGDEVHFSAYGYYLEDEDGVERLHNSWFDMLLDTLHGTISEPIELCYTISDPKRPVYTWDGKIYFLK